MCAHILNPLPGNERKQTEPGTLGITGAETGATFKSRGGQHCGLQRATRPHETALHAPRCLRGWTRAAGPGGHLSSLLWTAEVRPLGGIRPGLREEPQPWAMSHLVLGMVWVGEDDARDTPGLRLPRPWGTEGECMACLWE